MEKILKLYTYVDGTNDTPFPSADEQVIIGSFTYTANRMGGAPTISATVKHRLCLDDIWNDKVYAEFNGEKYFVINTPSSSKSNDDTRYEHDLELLSEREILNHVYFIDAVQGDSDTDVYKSNSTKVLFYGDIRQFVARLNASLSYRNLGYTAVIDDGITSKDKQVSFEDKYILEALQEEFNIFEIPYYFVGKVIHFGYTSNAITTTFKYGHDDAFLSISKDNANYAIINRITGVGSSDNIPYYYPNETDDQSAVEASGKKWITPSQNLMPSIYRESEGAEMFYEAKNNTYPDGEGGYYQFENEYSGTNPREGKTDFEDIKPTITGITNAAGQRIDMFSEFAYDTNDNDEVDEEGNYLHPYFFAKLRKTDGTYGFNLFDHAIESQTMQITFTSGICGACTFEIAVGEDTQKNLVQVGETSGALMRDEDGNVLCGREDLQHPQTPQDRQNDTKNYEVWIALRKDNSTYPQVMPNVNYNYKPSTSDTFAILGISLPQAYILKAEDELEKSLVKHMWMNNVEKFTFSAKFSRIFFTEHPEVLAQLNENARVIIEYNGRQHTLYIDNYSYKMDASSPLPEIDVDLVDTLSVGQNSLQTQLDSVKQDILSSIGGGDFLKNGLKYFLRKDTSDTARGKITFVRGIDIGTFAENTSGGTFRVLEDLTTYAEVDRLRVRVKAYFETLEIINTNSVGGKMILTAGGGVYLREVKDRETLEDGTEQVWDFYRCYFLTEQDGREVENRFHVGDLAMSQSFNIKAGTHQGVTNHYYWREVVGIGDDYIDLSKTICDTGSDAPMAEDTVCHLGNRSDKDRQGAIIFSAVDVFSPSITLYYGINDFSLVNKDYVSYGVDKSTGNAFFRVYGEMYAGDREQTSYVKYTPGVGVEMRGKFLNQAGESYDTIIDSIQNAIDGNIETWFGEEEPTLSNEPAVNWTTDEDKNTHLGDLYYSDAGVAYRFQMEGAQYVWKMLKDSDITKALADAKAAKDAANAAQEAADAAADRLTAWASDGVISPTEKQGIKDEIARIDADKANITAQYTKYGLGTPTAFNNAYTAYRAVLVSLSASTPENIAIPSDFSSKQAYYYNERTSALGAISDASITSVNNVTEQLEQMKQDFAEVKEDVAGVKTSVDGLKNFTDEAFADGIVDRNESAAIASHINSIETFAKDAAESYTKVYENTLLTGTAKTNLANAYTAFTTAKTELVTTINGAIADGLVDALEKSAVDGKYTAFNTKYGDFVANLNAANRAIQDAINQNALQALQKIGELDYLKAALKEFTTIEGGLIQSSTLALGYTSDSGYQVMAGTNGIYDASKLGGGIASWWGGAMFDRFEYTEETMPENVASALVRMDGTGYFAKGKFWWESDGTLHADPLSFFVGEDSVGDVLGLFQFVKSDAGVEYVIPQHPFQKLEIGNYLQIGKAQLYWDEANQAFYVRHQDGVSPVGFYATGFISTKGANPDAGGAVSGASKLTELEDVSVSSVANGQVLSWDATSQRWVNKTVEAGLDTAELEEYLTSHDYAKKSDIPALTGYATQEWVNTKLGSYATTSAMNSALGNKVDKVAGKGLSSNDFTDALLTKLNGIEEGANKYVLPTATGSVLGGVKVGATLAIASGVLNMKAVGTAGTYTKVTVDAYGRVTGHASLAATDIPNLPWSKITSGKPTTLAGYGITDAYTKTEADGRYVNVSGDTMTGNLTLKPLGGPWLNGKTQAPIMTNGASSTTGSTYHPIIWGKTDAGDVWNLAHGASDQVGFFGFYSERTANGTDWSTYIKVSTGVFYQSKAMNVTGLITATAGLTTPQYIQIGSGRIKWDSSNNALYVEKSDGTAIGFYSKGFISAKGANDDAGGSVSGVTALSQLSDVTLGTLANGQALVWDSTLQKWVNKTIESGLDETALAQYLTDNGYATQGWATSQFAYKTGTNASGTWPIAISVKDIRDTSPTPNDKAARAVDFWFNNTGKPGSDAWYSGITVKGWVDGYVVWQLASASATALSDDNLYFRSGLGTTWKSWRKILDTTNYTSTLDTRYLRTVSLATISDLHSSWDAVLKAQKPAWLTTVSLATISDLHASWDALLKAAPSAYMTRWPAWSEVTSKPTWIGANKPSYAFSEITGKPTTLGGYGITDGVNSVSVTGSGNAVTAASVSGHTLTLTKGSTFLLSSAYTAADVLAKLKTVDGSGSGLDADTLDGYHLSNIETGGWTRFITYIYDATNGTRYYSYRIGNLNKTGDVILRVRVCDDINYPSYSEWTLRMAYDPQYTPVVSLVPNTPCDRTLTVYVDSSKYLWIQCNATWTSYMEYKIEHQTGIVLITSNPTRVEEAPSNVAYTITNFGSTRNGVANKSYSYWAHTFNATTSIKIGSGTIYWDATNNCFHFSHGLYSDSFVSAKGANPDAGGTVSGVTKLSELSDVQLGTLATNQVLSWNGSKWVNKTLDMGLDETALAQYLTNNQYLTMPTGDGRYALKGGSNATGTWPISITGNAATATKLALQDTRSVNTAPFTGGEGLRYHFKQNTADGLKDGGTYHSVLQFNQWSEQSGGLCKQLALTDRGNMWFRTASSATAWGAWKKLLDSSNYSSIIGNSFVKKTGDTMSGKLTVNAVSSGNGTATFNNPNGGESYIYLQSGGVNKGAFTTMQPSYGTCIFDQTSSRYLGIKTDGTPHFNGNTLWHAGNDGSGSGLDADLLDGLHSTSLMRYSYNLVEKVTSGVTIANLMKTYDGYARLMSVNGWAWAASKTIVLNSSYSIDIQRYSLLDFRQGNLNGSWQQKAVLCLPTYLDSKMIYIAQMNTGETAGSVSTNVLRYADYDTILASNVYSATQLQTARTINGTAFNGTSNIVTSYWGTARTLSLTGNATGSVSMNGSSNVSMSVNVNYATSAGNADTLDGLHSSGLFVTNAGSLSSSSLNTFVNRNSGTYNISYSGYSRTLTVFRATGSSSGLELMSHHNGQLWCRWTIDSNRYQGDFKEFAWTSSNVASATKLQTARSIWGQSFNGTANVSGNMTGVGSITGSGSISMSGSITAGAYVYSNGWFQNQQSGEGLYNNAVDARWYANSSGWISDKKINANAGLGVSGTTTLGGAVRVPYTYGSWISMATRTNLIYSTTNNSQSSAHALYRVKANNGNALCFGGLGNYLGFYAFTAANISSSTNVVWKNTYWDMTNWKLTHGGALAVTGAITGSSTIYGKTGVYSDGYVSALGQNSSDARLKTNIQDFKATTLIKQLHPKSFKWNDLAKSKFEVFRNTGTQYGLIAQDVKEVMPEWVDDNLIGSGYMGIRYDKLIPVLLQGEIETISRVETLEDKVRRLEKENYKLKKKVKELERRTA